MIGQSDDVAPLAYRESSELWCSFLRSLNVQFISSSFDFGNEQYQLLEFLLNMGKAFTYSEPGVDEERIVNDTSDVFGDEAGHQIQYKTLSWQLVAVLMIAEIVSNGMLSLPSSAGVVGVCSFRQSFQSRY